MSLIGRLIGRRSDLPIRGDVTNRFLPWLVAPMVFLSVIALSGAFTLHGLIARWDRDASGTLTVEIPPAAGDDALAATKSRAWVDQAVALLVATPGVTSARPLSDDQLAALLAPWLGTGNVLRELPVPALIDVTVDPVAPPDVDDLQKRLADAIPGAELDDHRVWLARLTRLSRSLEWLNEGIVLLIGVATAITVIYATRTGMAVHRQTIEVMHTIGATDDYVARQFADRAFILGLIGGIGGLAVAVPVLLVLGGWSDTLAGGFLSGLTLPVAGWAAVAAVPVAAATLAMATARITVHATLARLL